MSFPSCANVSPTAPCSPNQPVQGLNAKLSPRLWEAVQHLHAFRLPIFGTQHVPFAWIGTKVIGTFGTVERDEIGDLSEIHLRPT